MMSGLDEYCDFAGIDPTKEIREDIASKIKAYSVTKSFNKDNMFIIANNQDNHVLEKFLDFAKINFL